MSLILLRLKLLLKFEKV